MVKKYLTSLKDKGNFSWSDLSKLSGLPDATIRKIFSGETSDPRFETVSKLVAAMGGSMDEIVEGPKEGQSEINAIIAIKEVYEARIADLKTVTSEHTSSLRTDKRYLAMVVCILGAVLIGTLLVDLCFGSIGWVRY